MTRKNLSFLNLITLSLLVFSCVKNPESPSDLSISEGLKNPIGFYDAEPSFSWKLPQGTIKQSAYEIVVASSPKLSPKQADLWQSGKVSSDQSTFVNYEGKALQSRQKAYWQVRFWDEKGQASKWSEVAHFELGLLSNDDWQAEWISIPASELTEKDKRKSLVFRPQYMRKEVNVNGEVKSARLYITAKGVYDAYINGQKVGNDVMSPGWTPRHSISTLTYDVTSLLQEGNNTLGAIVAEGWRSGRIDLRSTKKTLEHTPALLYQLEIETVDGKQTILSDNSWKVSNQGPIRLAQIYDGEFYDANYDLGAWMENTYNDKQWLIVETHAIEDSIALLPKRYQGVKDQEILSVQKITEPVKGKPIFNFGQNNVGVPLVKVPMKKGDTLTIRFAEMLNLDGTMYTDNYRGALSTDYYIAAKDGEIEWRPQFTFHGYQYIELSGYAPDAVPAKDWVKAIVQHSDIKKNGEFSSSHEKLNQLQSNITWGLRGNFFDIPTDCPQRDERLGWTGDAQVIAPTSVYNLDMYAFWAGYLQSIRQEQMENGGIPHVIPNVLNDKSSSGWADACVIIPWEMYFSTGDLSVLKENYETMRKWVGFWETKAEGRNFIPSNTSFRDWLQPYSTPQENYRMTRRGDTPERLVNAAYFARSVDLTMRSAKLLGYDEDAKELKALLDNIKVAFDQTFFDDNGKAKQKKQTQTSYLLALAFDLLPPEKIDGAVANLKQNIADCDNHLRTGFLGTPILPFVLDQAGEIDLMYEILFKETYPSWFYSINNGATTMWERWDSYTLKDGFHKDGMNSFNHYAYGAIGQWMYERIAGLKALSAGYKKIEIAPMPGGPLSSARASLETPYGYASSAWTLSDGVFDLTITIPPNTSAKVVIPTKGTKDILLNGEVLTESANVKVLSTNNEKIVLNVIPGNYQFQSQL